MLRILLLSVLALLCLWSCEEELIPIACNGDESLCDKRYNEVTYATTHNAFNYETGPVTYQGPNQDFPISDQLAFGIRGLMLDLYYPPGSVDGDVVVPWIYHTLPVLGFEPATNILEEIRIFLENNPNEVVTLILECYTNAASVELALDSAGLSPYLYHHRTAEYPTLKEMVQQNERLVILSDRDDAEGRDWYLYVWEHAVETNFSNKSRADFSCDYNRGEASNPLFILNHFITSVDLGIGLPDSSLVANSMPYLFDRAQECQSETGKQANFLTVDFYVQGQVMEAVNALNGLQ